MLTGLVTGLSLIVAIGAQNAFVLRQGIRREHVLTVVAVCATADALLVSAGVAGLGALVTEQPVALAVARYGGAAFLLVLAVQAALRARHPERLDPSTAAPAGHRGVLLTALALTFLNPHVYLDTVVLLGSVANQHGPTGRWHFAAGAAVGSVLWFTALGFGARRLRPLFARPRAWQVLDVVVAVVMVVVAVGLVV
ncbi:amino acid transporter [Actinotalea ferrariae]|uniref:LysE/ArgO family amino acid transporter n=1 Tax=Actinotalea ferrariae TaxID=1386098 RepID=UPI001C8CB5AC|nr:LysE/ArgO family amino acid transporter [Actinotalea ferrariae]MBX9244394.1 amino acid transporter [Actinotalea ferrariae]